MNIRITQSVLEQARDVAGVDTDEVAHLVKESGSTAVGIFPTGYEDDPWRAHLLRGEAVDDVSDAVVLRFPNSMESFRAKQALLRREREKGKQRSERAAMRRAADLIEGATR
jgi:hypothetical protein